VWFEIRSRGHLESNQIGRIVCVFLAAFIAPNHQAKVNLWGRSERVGFSQWNLMAGEEILLPMKLLILADNRPAVWFVVAPCVPASHRFPLGAAGAHTGEADGGECASFWVDNMSGCSAGQVTSAGDCPILTTPLQALQMS
jgi:hypothetical protein